MKKILIAGTSTRKRNQLAACLRDSSYEVLHAATSTQVWQAVMRQQIDLVISDACTSNAQLEPWQLITELFAVTDLPIVVLTRAGKTQDRVLAFRAGAYNCLSMPGSSAELVACLDRAFMGKGSESAQSINAPLHYVDSSLEIDLEGCQIHREGQSFPITSRERPLLERLIHNAGKVTSSRELCQLAWGNKAWPAKRSLLKTYISQLRRKIEQDVSCPRYIISHHGLGYAFVPQRTPKSIEPIES